MVGVLLQEAQPDHAGNLQKELLILRQDVRTDELYGLHQLILCIQDRHDPRAVLHEFRIDIFPIPGGKIGDIFAVALHPVDRRVVPRVGERLVETPEAPDEALRVHRDRLGEIAALGRDRADDRHRAAHVREGDHLAGALVERRKPRGEVGRKALLGRHLFHAA